MIYWGFGVSSLAKTLDIFLASSVIGNNTPNSF